jgi:oxalate decarboxylase/phosphoglucose isomerase-like protein (cupin superfamily)
MTFLIDGETTTAPAGSFVFIPRGVLHTFWNESDGPARQLTVFSPSGIEHYFDEATQALASGGEEALDAAMSLMEKHDMVAPRDARPAYGKLNPTG